ncbi:molybdenum cofactor guanylyltransferase MobA [Bosea sp. (in: a-proteobacteria)]|uniref:molybdenum cofactor guanylyltransferase MobA n=1 Tax=Bosea sp. (in: a-proteobacteria) TaxID=1871050 RepID=UPI001D529D34|nr:molybdenum cofactor guanylyltransferase MobA [Bosea sp. (in: a-proteobacteria)]MBA4222345.1 molybdenum cofactor guanylyltransferase MobA [Methylobacterium sp.]MBR3192975.1 molybdenum cofactor guanylyltransferase MobA [Bosea sp. (in: a-proteobacteria)]
MAADPTTLGLLLAGGLARRMGGGDKPLHTIAGRSMLAHVIERLSSQCAGLLLNANGDPVRFADYGLPIIADDVPDFAGPLAGILAGLDWLATNRPETEWLVSVAADTPFIPRDLVARLHAAREEAGVPLACAASGGRTHPVIGLWPVSLRQDLRHALMVEDERKVSRWAARHGVAMAEWPAEPVDPFFNANQPDELAEAERLYAMLGNA